MSILSRRWRRAAFAALRIAFFASALGATSARFAWARPIHVDRPAASPAPAAAAVPYDLDGVGSGAAGVVSGGGAGDLAGSFVGNNVNDLVGADRFYAAGYTGGGTIIANVEAGHIWSGHETLQHVLQLPNHPSSLNQLDRHATWVGMILGGRQAGGSPGEYQHGMAPDASLYSGAVAAQWNGTRFSLTFDYFFSALFDQYRRAFTGVGPDLPAADVVNSSWGTVDPTATGTVPVGIDGLAFANPHTLFVASAGNRGGSPNQVESPAAGFNNISVAALGPDPTFDAPAAFSSGGPNDYSDPINGFDPLSRQAIDIAAPGQQIGSAYYGGTSGGNGTTDNPSISGSGPSGAASGPAGGSDFYSRNLQGTSFAAPTVAGGAALLYDAAYDRFSANADARDARVVKAVLMNSADKTSGWDNDQQPHPNGLGGVSTTQGLDNRVGTGRMNLDRAFDQFLSGTTDVPGSGQGNLGVVDELGWDFGLVEEGTYNDYYFSGPLAGGSDFTATLTWFRQRRLDAGNGVFDEAFNDLDLELWQVVAGAPTTIISESISANNNSEHFSFAVPFTGEFALRVVFFEEAFDVVDAPNEEYYGLAWSAVVVPEPGTLALAIAAALVASCQRRRRGGAPRGEKSARADK